MTRSLRVAVLWGLSLGLGCEADPTDEPEVGPEVSEPAPIEEALLRELLGESIHVIDDTIEADGLLVRLAFEPLIRATGPVTLQLAQGQGYRLSGLADGAPLWLLGLRDGDVLTHVDGQPILGREHELRSQFEARPRRVEITTMRGTETRTLRLRVSRSPAWRASDSSDATPPDERLVQPPRLPAAERTVAAREFGEHLRCVETGAAGTIGRCEIERAALIGLIAEPNVLISQARVVPAVREGQTIGFKLYGIRRETIPARLGLANGDLIVRVDGRPLTSMDAVLEVYAALGGLTRFSVAVERRGTMLELELELVDTLSGPAASLSSSSSPTSTSDLRDPFGGR